MTKEYHAELKALRKQLRALGRERLRANRTAERESRRITRERERARRLAAKVADVASVRAMRELQLADKIIRKNEKAITARIAVLEGRL